MSKTSKAKKAKQNRHNKNNLKKDVMFKWRLEKLIFDFPESAQKELTKKRLIHTIIPALQEHEGLKLLDVTHNNSKHHTVNFAKSSNTLGKKRLEQSDDFLGIGYRLFSFRIDSNKRLYGYIDESVFYPIWYDHHHQLYPSAKKRT